MNHWWQNITWKGCIRSELVRPEFIYDFSSPCVDHTWARYCVPAETQHWPSCAGHGWANWKEIMLRYKLGLGVLKPFEQISGDAIWRRGREVFYGDQNGGLTIGQAFEAAMDLGIFVPGSELKTLSRHEALYGDQFLRTPFVDAHDVSAWETHGVQDNGQVFEGGTPNGTGGHCTVRISRMLQRERNFVQYLNSWGPTFGWNGCYTMSAEFDDDISLESRLYYVQEPEGWEKDSTWKKWIAP
jgi:hypothetical protein